MTKAPKERAVRPAKSVDSNASESATFQKTRAFFLNNPRATRRRRRILGEADSRGDFSLQKTIA